MTLGVDDTETPNLKLPQPRFNKRTWHNDFYKAMSIVDAVLTQFIAIAGFAGVWDNSTAYAAGAVVVDQDDALLYRANTGHTSTATGTFAAYRTANPTHWELQAVQEDPMSVWAPNTAYTVRDFVVDNQRYAVCIEAHTSGSDFDNDSAKWSILIDLSAVVAGSLPVFSAPDANKHVGLDGTGSAYVLKTAAESRTDLALGTIATQAAAAVAITGGSINGTIIGGTSAANGTFASLSASSGNLNGVDIGPSVRATAIRSVTLNVSQGVTLSASVAQGSVETFNQTRFVATLTAAQNNLADNTIILFDTIPFESDLGGAGGFNTGTGRYTVPTGEPTGLWLLHGAITLTDVDSACTLVGVRLRKNGSTIRSKRFNPSIAPADFSNLCLDITALDFGAPGDIYDLVYDQTGGANQSDVQTTFGTSDFSGIRMA